MAYYPQNATGLNYVSAPVGPTPSTLTLTASGSTNTKGSYTQLVASLGFTSNAVIIDFVAATNSASALFDIATGAGGAEVVVIPNVATDSWATSTLNSAQYSGRYPLSIASGTRVAGRCQSSTASGIVAGSLTFIAAGGVAGQTTFTNYGAATGTSRGTNVDPGGTVNTKGSYVQLTASTSAVIQWMAVTFSQHASAATGTVNWMTDLATGAGGSEVVLIPDMWSTLASTGTPSAYGARSQEFLTYIAASTRIAARCSCGSNTATTRTIDVELLTCVAPSEPSGSTGGAWAYA
jgi:hypothetical protein